jgi:hypothetical protein
MKFSEIVSINRFNLPEECEQHAGYYHQISEKTAEVQSELDKLQDELKLHLAEKELEIRQTWSDSDGKMTEGSVAAKLISAKSVTSRKEAIRDKQKDLGVLEAAKSAFEHRKAMLNNLTSLLIGGFYSAPSGSRAETRVSSQERSLRKKINEEN